jgi:hypothetical protein
MDIKNKNERNVRFYELTANESATFFVWMYGSFYCDPINQLVCVSINQC